MWNDAFEDNPDTMWKDKNTKTRFNQFEHIWIMNLLVTKLSLVWHFFLFVKLFVERNIVSCKL